jgi:glucosylceramidase
LEVWADTIMGQNQSVVEISGNFPQLKLKGTLPPPIPSKSAQYVDGMAFHWYSGSGDRNMDGTYGYDALRSVHEKFPEKILLATEACSCPGVAIGNWMRAERTGHDVMYDLNNFAQGWIDWNLVVNSVGGPNHLKNFCDAPIVTFENFTGFHVQPKFFYMGHFSKFIKPEAVRIDAEIIGNFNNVLDNPNLQSGVEVGIYLCEQSSRQMWVLRESGQIQLALASTYDHEPVGVFGDESIHELCLAPGDETRPFVRVRNCDGVDPEQKAYRFTVVPATLPSKSNAGSKLKKDIRSAGAAASTKTAGQIEYSQLQVVGDGHSEPKCLSIHKTSDQYANGDVLSLKKCDASSIAQLWYLPSSAEHGAIRPLLYEAPGAAPAPTCLTAGWPFLSATAALNPDGSKAIVVMNEAPRSCAFTVSDSDRGTISMGIAGRSIQTITY